MIFRLKKTLLLLLYVVVAVGSASADDLIVAPDNAPKYRLSNIRIDHDRFGRRVLAVDYERTRVGEMSNASVRVAGKTKSGELSLFGFSKLDASGTVRLALQPSLMGDADFEIYFVTSAGSNKRYLVSNIVRLGNPGPASRARSLTAKEKEDIARAKLRATPPASLPDGHLAVDQGTKLVPGMPVKAGWYGEWKNAEVISFKVAGPVVLKYEGELQLESHPREKWIAVDPEVAKKAKSSPDQFQVSVRTLPESTAIIPDGAVLLEGDVKLLPGTPMLLNEHGSMWKDVFVIETQGDKVNLRYKNFSSTWDKMHPRNKLVITKDVLSQLEGADQDAIEKKFAGNLVSGGRDAGGSSFPRTGSKRRSIRHKRYEIDIPIPKGAQLVPDDLTIEKGTALAGCWANKWKPITALYENDDGSLHVRWDDYSEAWNCNMTRDQLIIQDKTVRKLNRKTNKAEADLEKTLRTWTDSTGKYKIEAWYVRRTAKQVYLKTDAGRELNMPIEKLSDEDRALLPEMESSEENPFE